MGLVDMAFLLSVKWQVDFVGFVSFAGFAGFVGSVSFVCSEGLYHHQEGNFKVCDYQHD